jgi:hypothetical protein
MAKSKKTVAVETEVAPMRINFKDGKAKELFEVILNDYGTQMEDLMSQISVAKGYGATDPNITVLGDGVLVESVPADKGVVITDEGFGDYKGLPLGKKYLAIDKKGRSMVYTKSGEGNADSVLGTAVSLSQLLAELVSEDLDVKAVKPRDEV